MKIGYVKKFLFSYFDDIPPKNELYVKETRHIFFK